MKQILLTAIMSAGFILPAYADPSDGFHMLGYTLAWSDEFDGDALDRSAWNVEINGTGCGNNELQYYIDSPDNVAVRDGNLVITARRGDYQGKHFTSGRLNTADKITFTYGIIEARIKLPSTADGLWPAFWMMGNDIISEGWPKCGETDVLEMGHFNGINRNVQDRLFNGALHWGAASDQHAQKVGDRLHPTSLQDGEYHNFYVVWTPQSIEMFVDDFTEPYLSVDISTTDDVRAPGCYFHKPNFLLVNLAVGGQFPGIYDADKITALDEGPASMFVDYIRVYQRDNNVTLGGNGIAQNQK